MANTGIEPAIPNVPQRANAGRIRLAVDNLLESWLRVTRGARDALAGLPDPSLPSKDAARIRERIVAWLHKREGDITARERAVELGALYLGLNAMGRERFLRLLAELDPPREAIERSIEHLHAAKSDEAFFRASSELSHTLRSPRISLLAQFNGLPSGVKFLVDLRADLLALHERSPALERLSHDLKELLAGWFDVGFLELRRITWDSPASLLERLANYEAVVEIKTWLDLKNRLDVDRRCFAFFHPVMPDEPLIFVEVALVEELPSLLAPLLDPSSPVGNPRTANTAIFYSISNCQRGLDGISFGNALIKRVAREIAHDLPQIRTFATLSPIPGFRRWLDERLNDPARAEELTALRKLQLQSGRQQDTQATRALEQPLLQICARYLLEEKSTGRRALDPVTHFHISNGARLERINCLANKSRRGMRESYGLMANYLYALDQLDANHEAYVTEGRIAASHRVTQLLK
jgi:malonyl-CoA decarboxylase